MLLRYDAVLRMYSTSSHVRFLDAICASSTTHRSTSFLLRRSIYIQLITLQTSAHRMELIIIVLIAVEVVIVRPSFIVCGDLTETVTSVLFVMVQSSGTWSLILAKRTKSHTPKLPEEASISLTGPPALYPLY